MRDACTYIKVTGVLKWLVCGEGAMQDAPFILFPPVHCIPTTLELISLSDGRVAAHGCTASNIKLGRWFQNRKDTFEDWVEFFVEQDERTFWLALKTPTRVDIWDAALDIQPGAFVVKGVPGTRQRYMRRSALDAFLQVRAVEGVEVTVTEVVPAKNTRSAWVKITLR